MKMLDLYRFTTDRLQPTLDFILSSRIKKRKEVPERIEERRGMAALPRPPGPLAYLHAASVGEAQSALILIHRLLSAYPDINLLVTSGTVTSAAMLQKNLPARSFHQFAPLDHLAWVRRFLDHWQPDCVLWMESELWPNMLGEIKRRNIPAALVNARLSDKSHTRWRMFKSSAAEILSAFSMVLAQTAQDEKRFKYLGAKNITVTDNIKYSAKPLPADEKELGLLAAHLRGRPLWLFASTHDGEEAMACRVHQQLKASIPDILTVIAPRHPARRDDIRKICESSGLNTVLRGDKKNMPLAETDLYVADTMGEMGLFYRLAPVACIGRSFSADGGGGHNPIEAAQLSCAVLFGPRVQFQQALYDDMAGAQAAWPVHNESELCRRLHDFLTNPAHIEKVRHAALAFSRGKEHVIEHVMNALRPILEQSLTKKDSRPAHAV